MATQRDVRRIVLSLPETRQAEVGFSFSVLNKGKAKGIAWSWLERVTPKKPRVPRADVIAVRVADETVKQMLLSADEDTYFTEPHYNGYPAVLVRLPAIAVGELADLLTNAWRCQAPRALVEAFDARPRRTARKAAPRKAAGRGAKKASPR